MLVLGAQQPLMAPSDIWNLSVGLAVRNLLTTGPLFVAEFAATALVLLLDPALALIGLPVLFLQCLRLTARLGVRRVGEVRRGRVLPSRCRRNMRHADENRYRDMRYRRRGASGQPLSPISLGLWHKLRRLELDRRRSGDRPTGIRPRGNQYRPGRDRPPAWAVTRQNGDRLCARDSRLTHLPSSVSAAWHSPERDSLHRAASNTARRSSRRSMAMRATPSYRRPLQRTAPAGAT